jgi:hypothetical protein
MNDELLSAAEVLETSKEECSSSNNHGRNGLFGGPPQTREGSRVTIVFISLPRF